MIATTKPRVALIGHDGNAFSILGRCARAARRAGWTVDQIEEFQTEATSGDYNDLLATVASYFEID